MLIVAPSPSDSHGTALRTRLTGFAGFLHANGFGVGGGDTARVLATAEQVGIFDGDVLRWSLKALLCGRGDEWRRFDTLFDAYFLPPNRKAFAESRPRSMDSPRPAEPRTPRVGRCRSARRVKGRLPPTTAARRGMARAAKKRSP